MAASKVEFKTTDLTELGWQPSGESWRYRVLSEEALQAELARLSNPESNSAARTDSVTIQPCQLESEKSQDRLAVQVWDLPGGTWTFAMVLDGHAGDETAELAVKTLPSDLQDRLGKALASRSSDITSIVPAVIQETLTSFDESLVSDLKSIFPGGIDEIQKLSDAEIKAVINDSDRGGVNNAVVLRCMRGSTALISLIDPHHNVYVASLGDCQAVLVSQDPSGVWSGDILSSTHNGFDQAEVQRVRDAHPGEETAVMGYRVLGAIMVTRALGDFSFKLHPAWTTRVFLNSEPGFKVHSKVEDFIARSHTPPYMTATADIQYRSHDATRHRFLVLASDGLTDLFSNAGGPPVFDQTIADKWATALGDASERPDQNNLALALLRTGLGGSDLDKCSKYLTVESKERLIDDTTVIVHKF